MKNSDHAKQGSVGGWREGGGGAVLGTMNGERAEFQKEFVPSLFFLFFFLDRTCKPESHLASSSVELLHFLVVVVDVVHLNRHPPHCRSRLYRITL